MKYIKKFESMFDEEGESVDKSEFIFIIEDISNSQDPWKQEMSQDGLNIIVSVWDAGEQFMVDDEIGYLFPELSQIGLYDIQEGVLEYSGNLTAQELVDELTSRGFKARIA